MAFGGVPLGSHDNMPSRDTFKDGPLAFGTWDHQTFQVPKMEVSSPSFSCMDTAYGYGSLPTPKIAENTVQETLHFRYLRFLVIGTLPKHSMGLVYLMRPYDQGVSTIGFP